MKCEFLKKEKEEKANLKYDIISIILTTVAIAAFTVWSIDIVIR